MVASFPRMRSSSMKNQTRDTGDVQTTAQGKETKRQWRRKKSARETPRYLAYLD